MPCLESRISICRNSGPGAFTSPFYSPDKVSGIIHTKSRAKPYYAAVSMNASRFFPLSLPVVNWDRNPLRSYELGFNGRGILRRHPIGSIPEQQDGISFPDHIKES